MYIWPCIYGKYHDTVNISKNRSNIEHTYKVEKLFNGDRIFVKKYYVENSSYCWNNGFALNHNTLQLK